MDEIRQDIDQIRNQMDTTLKAIQDRVSPEHLMEQAREAVSEVTHGAVADVAQNTRDAAGNVGSAALNVIRDHPISTALVGLGVGWLLTARSQTQAAGQQVTEVREQISGAVGDAATHAQASAQQIGSQAATLANRSGNVLQQALHDSPLAVGAAVLAVGAVVALAVPQTPQEHQLMGPTRDRLVAKAQETAQEMAERAQAAAQDTAQKVQHVAMEARDAAQRTAQQEGLM